MNSVNLIGRLAADPELRYTAAGKAVCNLRVAIPRPKRDGEDRAADFVDVTVWERQAETCEQYLSKGRRVGVSGRLTQQHWTAADGAKRSSIEVVAVTVDFLESAPKADAEPDAPADPADPAPADAPKAKRGRSKKSQPEPVAAGVAAGAEEEIPF